MTKLIAKAAMRYGGMALKAGDSFVSSERDARTLIAIGKAELEPEAVKEKRAYRRRDMKAEG